MTSKNIIGSSAFISTKSAVDQLIENGKIYEGYIPQYTTFNLRSTPTISSTNITGTTGLDDTYFKVLGKIEDNNSQVDDWFYVELLKDMKDFSTKNKIAAGTKGFIARKSEMIIKIKSYDKFLKDVKAIVDLHEDDSLLDAITRLRQNSHKSNVKFFNDVIGATVEDPVYQDDLENDTSKSLTLNIGGTNYTVLTNIQLFKDYSVAQLSNGKSFEIQHLLVGLDIYEGARIKRLEYISYSYGPPLFEIHFTLYDNVNSALYSGDAGSAISDMILQNKPGMEANYKTVNKMVQSNPIPRIDALGLYYKYNFPLADLFGDVLCFGLFYTKVSYVIAKAKSAGLVSVLKQLNIDYEGIKQSGKSYIFLHLGGNISLPIDDSAQPFLPDLLESTEKFSEIWYLKTRATPGNIFWPYNVEKHYQSEMYAWSGLINYYFLRDARIYLNY